MQNPKPYVIVVGIDYSNTGELALTRAFELATERQNAEVHIVHVVQTLGAFTPLEFGGTVGGPDSTMIAEASEQLRKYADKRLQEFKQGPFADGKTKLFERAISHLRLDSPAHELAQIASDLDADLLVVGTHGRRGATRLLIGSVAEGVVRLAPCAVLVVRNKFVDHTVPKIEPPCPRCIEARRESNGAEMWCAQHRERHGRRHTYHQIDRAGMETNLPLVTPER